MGMGHSRPYIYNQCRISKMLLPEFTDLVSCLFSPSHQQISLLRVERSLVCRALPLVAILGIAVVPYQDFQGSQSVNLPVLGIKYPS